MAVLTEEQKRAQRHEHNRQVAGQYSLRLGDSKRSPNPTTKPQNSGIITRSKSPLAPLQPGEFADVVAIGSARNTRRYRQRMGA